MRQGLSRGAAALVLILFCVPLFVGLGRTDLQNDESIYSFAVDRILETGEWLTPRSSPDESAPFFEKPPLKFWIVAGAIRLGALPHDEFGLRFWDALFGSLAFVYVFLIGRRVAGPLCGIAAVAVLFVHFPLVFDHGLRSNNMEAALLLAYCGGMYHFLAWAESGRRGNAIAVGLFFVLGFMTKFVAALFLPLVIAAAMIVVPSWRRSALRSWTAWAASALLAAILIAPWFAYEHVKSGSDFWHVLFGEHVFRRMTVSIDPGHVHAWNYYFLFMHRVLVSSDTYLLAIAGAALLLIEAARRRRGEHLLVVFWFAIPMFLISLSPSKIYHYMYPFLPPVAIAAGLVPAFLWSAVQPRAVATAAVVEAWLRERRYRAIEAFRRPAVARVLLALAGAALVIGALAAIGIPVRWKVGGVMVLRNAQVLRPWIVAFVAATLAGRSTAVARLLVPLVIVAIMPVAAYRTTVARLPVQDHPQRDARDCVLRIMDGDPRPGVYVQIMEGSFVHSYYYYFRRFGTWEWVHEPDDAGLYANVWGPAAHRPVLVSDDRYGDFRAHLRDGDPDALARVARAAGVTPGSLDPRAAQLSAPMIRFATVLLVLPGRYAACSADARAPATR